MVELIIKEPSITRGEGTNIGSLPSIAKPGY
jgi:hypothetical protein